MNGAMSASGTKRTCRDVCYLAAFGGKADNKCTLIRSTPEAFKIVKVHGASDEVLARIDNFEICKAAFEKALFMYPKEHLEMRQGARIILKSKES